MKRLAKPSTASDEVQLDALNATLRGKQNSAGAVRQLMEADIEAKAKRRRAGESNTSPASKK